VGGGGEVKKFEVVFNFNHGAQVIEADWYQLKFQETEIAQFYCGDVDEQDEVAVARDWILIREVTDGRR